MAMTLNHYSRHYYVSENLDDLKRTEEELKAHNIDFEQFHVLSLNDAEVVKHEQLHEVRSLFKKDIVHSIELGAIVGLVLSSLLILVVYFTNLPSFAGWMPFVFLAIVILGFSTWQGGLFGIQTPNKEFVQFDGLLHQGKHIFFVDVEVGQEAALDEVMKHHPKLTPAGTGEAQASLWIQAQHKWHSFRRVFP
jgi:hypothetical protein